MLEVVEGSLKEAFAGIKRRFIHNSSLWLNVSKSFVFQVRANHCRVSRYTSFK